MNVSRESTCRLLIGVWAGTVLGAAAGAGPAASIEVVARGGDRSVLLHWSGATTTAGDGYHIYRADRADGPFARITATALVNPAYADNSVENGLTYHYRVQHAGAVSASAQPSPTVTASAGAFASDDEFLDFLQYAAFQYFWRETNPANGLVRDRSRPDSVSSIAATGFGLTALGIGKIGRAHV